MHHPTSLWNAESLQHHK